MRITHFLVSSKLLLIKSLICYFLCILLLKPTTMIQNSANSEMNNFIENSKSHSPLSVEKYRSVFDAAGDAMFLSDKETGQILEANKAAVAMYGFEKSEFIQLRIADLLAESDKTAQALNTELNHAPVRYHKKKNGIVFPVEITATYFEQFGKKVSVVNIRDISLRLENEKALLEKNKEIEQLIYITSHDFRTPLLNIKGYSNELKTVFRGIKSIVLSSQNIENIAELNKYFEEDIPEAFQYIDGSCTEMNTMIDGMLKISKLRQVELFYQRINMTKFCNSIVALHNNVLKEKNITVEIESLPDCVADINLMNQVLSNLFSNAIKFIKKEVNGFVKITGTEDLNSVTYCVADNGIGIPEGKETIIFEMFKKLNSDTGGEGIGLTIVWKIIERHKGHVWVESEEGNGCRFFLQLPKLS